MSKKKTPPKTFFEKMFTFGDDGPAPELHDLLGAVEEKEQIPYEVLGLTGTETKAEAEKIYRALARKNHPDLHQTGKKKYHDKMARITEAWEAIKKAKQW